MLFEFSGLQALYHNMRKQNETRSIFNFSYNSKPFRCLFIIDTSPYTLTLATTGEKPFAIEISIYRGFLAQRELPSDKYAELCVYLQLRYSKDHKFIPADLFGVLNKNISTTVVPPRYSEVLKIRSLTRDIEEPDKNYFIGWRNNGSQEHVSERNLEKTKMAFGSRLATQCLKKNVSSRWSNILSDEDLSKLNDIL